MRMTPVRLKAVPIAIAVLLSGFGSASFALPVTYGNITLDAAYDLGGPAYPTNGTPPGSLTNGMTDPNASLYVTPSGADLYLFTSDSAGNNAFFHTYGFTGAYTYFGARASGAGNFYATTRATFSQVFTNTSAVAQLFNFSFDVASGDLGITGTGTGYADLLLSVKKNGTAVSQSRTTITQTASGVSCDDSSGDIGSLAGYMNCSTGTSAFDNGGLYGVSMGLVGAGESFTLDYDIIATVSGNLSQGTRLEQQCYGGYGGGIENPDVATTQAFIGDNGYGGGSTCIDILVPVPGEAIARSGDPFSAPIFALDGTLLLAPDGGAGLTGRFSDVPEPGSIALVGLGLAGLAALRRKRKSDSPA